MYVKRTVKGVKHRKEKERKTNKEKALLQQRGRKESWVM
jgi:hypothetical protein